MSAENRERLALRMEPKTRAKIERWYREAGCTSMNEFVEKAVNSYADQLDMGENEFLPLAVTSALNGRLSLLEKNLSALSFRYAVLLDMVSGILADGFQLEPEELERRRRESVKNVKRLNGRISLEDRVKHPWEDEWQD